MVKYCGKGRELDTHNNGRKEDEGREKERKVESKR